MLVQLRKHDGNLEEIEVLNSAFAREIATAFDWDPEYRRFEHLAETGATSFPPSLSFTNDAGRTLEFGPNAEAFWVSYSYFSLKSTFGFCPVDQSIQQVLGGCDLEFALQLLDRHYQNEHLELISLLPPPDYPPPFED